MAIKTVRGTAKVSSGSSAFQALLTDVSESVNIESAMVFRELPITRPAKRSRHWPHLFDIPIEETEDEILVLIVSEVPEVLKQTLGKERVPMPCALCWDGWYLIYPAAQPAKLGRSAACSPRKWN